MSGLSHSDPTAPERIFPAINHESGRAAKLKKAFAVSLFHLFVGIAWLGISPARALDSRHGTHIEVLHREDSVIVAADGREIKNGTPVENEKCKIKALNPHALFAATGPLVHMTANLVSGQELEIYDSYNIASAVFLPSLDLSFVSDRWADSVTDKFNSVVGHTSAKVPLNDNDLIVQGMFFGEQHGEIRAVVKRLQYSMDGPNFVRATLEDFPPSQFIGYFGIPHLELVREFFNNESERAKTVKDEMNRKIADEAIAGIDVDALHLKTLTEFIIKWAHDPAIGGAVSVAVLVQGNPLRWFSRSPACGG